MKARKQARRAELESRLRKAYYSFLHTDYSFKNFDEWMTEQTTKDASLWRDEAIELIALYGE